MEQLIYEFQPILEKKDLTCRLVATDDIMLKCDADKMQRVFDNLLRNAVVYSYNGSDITVEAKDDTLSKTGFYIAGSATPLSSFAWTNRCWRDGYSPAPAGVSRNPAPPSGRGGSKTPGLH